MPFIIIGIIVLIIFFAFLSFKNPKVLGERGENQVKRIIGKTVENEQYVINNLRGGLWIKANLKRKEN